MINAPESEVFICLHSYIIFVLDKCPEFTRTSGVWFGMFPELLGCHSFHCAEITYANSAGKSNRKELRLKTKIEIDSPHRMIVPSGMYESYCMLASPSPRWSGKSRRGREIGLDTLDVILGLMEQGPTPGFAECSARADAGMGFVISLHFPPLPIGVRINPSAIPTLLFAFSLLSFLCALLTRFRFCSDELSPFDQLIIYLVHFACCCQGPRKLKTPSNRQLAG